LETLLDQNQYEDSRLTELKIPVHMPYQTSWATFERYDGEVEMNGIIYKYVKRKLCNDTLYLLCIPNTAKMNLETARGDFFKNTNDLQNNNSKQGNSKSNGLKNMLTDYDGHAFVYTMNACTGFSYNIHFSYQENKLFSSPHISPEQPPEQPVA
jgi:hypothetical protein